MARAMFARRKKTVMNVHVYLKDKYKAQSSFLPRGAIMRD
jgi:hypothetical protein